MPKFFTALLMLVFFSSAAQAHKVVFAVYDEGETVEGEVGFSNGDMAAGALVEYFTPDGKKLGETKSDQDGLFTLPLRGKGSFLFKANLGAGHIGEAVLNRAGGATPTVAKTASKSPVTAELEKLIERGVARQIKPLRKELAAYKEENDLQKILGGLGYIIGLAGIGFYMAARQKLKKAEERPHS